MIKKLGFIEYKKISIHTGAGCKGDVHRVLRSAYPVTLKAARVKAVRLRQNTRDRDGATRIITKQSTEIEKDDGAFWITRILQPANIGR